MPDIRVREFRVPLPAPSFADSLLRRSSWVVRLVRNYCACRDDFRAVFGTGSFTLQVAEDKVIGIRLGKPGAQLSVGSFMVLEALLLLVKPGKPHQHPGIFRELPVIIQPE
jgi:hypothetical protein